ncbi:MAG: hypothetical protein J5682_07425, partial [Prevotella sp.]|nr:hypothetical protein [Prevotella sp.]
TGLADIFLNFGASKWGELVVDEVIVVTEESAERVLTAPGAGVKALDVENYVANNADMGTHNLYYNDNSKGKCVYTNQNARFFYMGRFNVDNIKAIRVCGNMVPAGSRVTSISVNFYDTTEETIDATYLGNISQNLRNGKHTFFNIYGTSTLNSGTSLWNNGFKRGPFYTADFTTKTITADVAGFREYWNDNTAAVTLTQTLEDATEYTSAFTTNTATGEKDLYLVFAAQNGRAAVSDLVVYMTDGSAVTLPVTSMTAGLVTNDDPATLTPGVLASSYLNTTGESISAATLGNVALTAENIAAYTELADANVALTAANVSYNFTVGTAKAATLMLPFAAELPTGVTAYTLSYTAGADAVDATEATALVANTPVLANAEAGTYTFTAANAAINAVAAQQGALTGVYAETVVPSGSYILTNGDTGVGFRMVDGETNKVAPYRAYLTADGGGARLAIRFNGGETTGINDAARLTETQQVYNISGQRVAQPQKGLYIVNGKKVILK